jgi:hypothetical protein
VVESGTQVVDDLADDHSPHEWRIRSFGTNDDPVSSGISLMLKGNNALLLFDPGLNFVLKRISLELRSLNLEAHTDETVHHALRTSRSPRHWRS